MKKEEIPHYYIGKKHKIEARKVIEDFQADSYNIGTAITYLLRAGKKEGNPAEQDIRKAINHLHFELDRIYKNSGTLTGGLAETGIRS
tara:strand:- start:33 stop:296 length:264 start_codon:yes stop_codon:yes gene_type:complete